MALAWTVRQARHMTNDRRDGPNYKVSVEEREGPFDAVMAK